MNARSATQTADLNPESIVKALLVVGSRVEDPSSRGGGEQTSAFADAGALAPPYDPEAMCLLVEHSNSLRQNVDAYATNIDGFGFRFDPVIDFGKRCTSRCLRSA
jgi:capsid portal protein